MRPQNFDPLISAIRSVPRAESDGSISGTASNTIEVRGLSKVSRVGDLVRIFPKGAAPSFGEILALKNGAAEVLPEAGSTGMALNDRVRHYGPARICPDKSWIGRIIDPFLRPLDNSPLVHGTTEVPMKAAPPAPAQRRRMGERIPTGLAALDTLLPIVRGQRIGVFAGSGVGKSTLLADLAKGMKTDLAVITLVGERGRELRDFVEDVLGPEGMKRSIVIASTSDQPPMVRRRAAWVGMAVAEYFRDRGSHVLFLMDSVTRFAEAHREISSSAGEAATMAGFPPSTSQELMALSERAGPGAEGTGDITGVFSVLVQGSNMEGPIADVMRGVLDGHIVLDRKIAERGRFPAIDVLRSVSRSLPAAATADELAVLKRARALLSAYSEAELMIQAGLYTTGSDPTIDAAILARPKLEVLFSQRNISSINTSFEQLAACFGDD